MVILFFIFIFIFGISIGSFLNVLTIRLGGEEKKGIGGRSHCPKCGRELAWQDLVPVLSFFWLGGKCRYCGKKISWQYPIVELVTGILFVLIFFSILNFNPSAGGQFFNFSIFNLTNLIFLLFVVSCLFVIFVSDLQYFIIPDEIIITGVIGTLVFRLVEILDLPARLAMVSVAGGGFGIFKPFGLSLISALVASAFFLLIVLITRGRGMGLGDVKLAFLMGLVLGWPQILAALLFAFVSGALVGLGLIAAGRAKMKSEIPFGTFLAAATLLTIFFGSQINVWYSGLFF